MPSTSRIISATMPMNRGLFVFQSRSILVERGTSALGFGRLIQIKIIQTAQAWIYSPFRTQAAEVNPPRTHSVGSYVQGIIYHQFRVNLILDMFWYLDLPYLRRTAPRSYLLSLCISTHRFLKHSAISARLLLSPSSAGAYSLHLNTFSHRLKADETIMLGSYFLNSPSNKASSITYLQKLSIFSLAAYFSWHTASKSWQAVVLFRLNFSVSMMLPSMSLRSLMEQVSAVTSTQFLVLGGQIYSYLLAIHRQAMPTSWQSSLEIYFRAEQSARQIRARCRVCCFSSKDQCTSMSQSMRICLIFSLMCFWLSTGSFFQMLSMNQSAGCLYSHRGSRTGRTAATWGSFLPQRDLALTLGSILLATGTFSYMLLFFLFLLSMLVMSLPKKRRPLSLREGIRPKCLQECSEGNIFNLKNNDMNNNILPSQAYKGFKFMVATKGILILRKKYLRPCYFVQGF